MTQSSDSSFENTSRRDFLRTSTAAAVAGSLVGALGISRSAYAGGSDMLRLGLIGCGGRGTGAAAQALTADKNMKLVAAGDTFDDRLQSSLGELASQMGADRVAVGQDHRFIGFDAYQKVLDSGVDVVILSTPPHFRPLHLKAAVASGKHIFCEKPVAVDAPGVRSVMESVAEAEKKNLCLVSGLCYRYDLAKRETFKRVHDGAIGDIQALHVSYYTNTLKYAKRKPEWSDMEWQMRNWQHFTWLSGDHNVEQHVHSLDKAAWAMHDTPPLRAIGIGGQQVHTEPEFGDAYDHFAVMYEYANGVRLFSNCRQQDGCTNDVSDYLIGTKGTCQVMQHTIAGAENWTYKGPKPNMYQVEHDELFAAIRSGKPINNGQYMVRSTLMAILGRMAAYTGQSLTWEQALNSKEDLSPPKYEFGPLVAKPAAKPGITQFS